MKNFYCIESTNRLEVIAVEGERLKIRLTRVMEDVNYYEGTKPKIQGSCLCGSIRLDKGEFIQMGYDGKSLFECVYHPMCTCCQLPSCGNFTVGKDYTFEYIIDARKVKDNQGEAVTITEDVFLSSFENLGEAVTSFSPILSDTTEYHIFLILSSIGCSLEEIKAYAKVMNVSYLQAKRVLTQKRNLFAVGSAYDIWKILGRLAQFDVHYEIEPEYPYE